MYLWHNWGPKNWGVVEPGFIYRSGLMEPGQVKRALQKNNIRVIVSLCGRDASKEQVAQEIAARELGVEILWLPMKGDGTTADGTMDLHVAAVAAICKARREGKPVLIQCGAGANRTGGVVAAYQLLVQRKNPQEVLAEMREHRFDPHDNAVMLEFLNRNMRAAAQKLVEMGVIKDVPAVTAIPSKVE